MPAVGAAGGKSKSAAGENLERFQLVYIWAGPLNSILLQYTGTVYCSILVTGRSTYIYYPAVHEHTHLALHTHFALSKHPS